MSVASGNARAFSILTRLLPPVAVRITNKCPAGEADISGAEFPDALFRQKSVDEMGGPVATLPRPPASSGSCITVSGMRKASATG